MYTDGDMIASGLFIIDLMRILILVLFFTTHIRTKICKGPDNYYIILIMVPKQ